MRFIKAYFLALLLVSLTILISPIAYSQTVAVVNAWARATVPGQTTTGIFMNLTSPLTLKLIGVSTPVAASAEIHQMRMDGNLMRMQSLAEVSLPAGKSIEFKPGGYHIMLLDLQTPLLVGNSLPVTLKFQNAQQQIIQQTIVVTVKK